MDVRLLRCTASLLLLLMITPRSLASDYPPPLPPPPPADNTYSKSLSYSAKSDGGALVTFNKDITAKLNGNIKFDPCGKPKTYINADIADRGVANVQGNAFDLLESIGKFAEFLKIIGRTYRTGCSRGGEDYKPTTYESSSASRENKYRSKESQYKSSSLSSSSSEETKEMYAPDPYLVKTNPTYIQKPTCNNYYKTPSYPGTAIDYAQEKYPSDEQKSEYSNVYKKSSYPEYQPPVSYNNEPVVYSNNNNNYQQNGYEKKQDEKSYYLNTKYEDTSPCASYNSPHINNNYDKYPNYVNTYGKPYTTTYDKQNDVKESVYNVNRNNYDSKCETNEEKKYDFGGYNTNAYDNVKYEGNNKYETNIYDTKKYETNTYDANNYATNKHGGNYKYEDNKYDNNKVNYDTKAYDTNKYDCTKYDSKNYVSKNYDSNSDDSSSQSDDDKNNYNTNKYDNKYDCTKYNGKNYESSNDDSSSQSDDDKNNYNTNKYDNTKYNGKNYESKNYNPNNDDSSNESDDDKNSYDTNTNKYDYTKYNRNNYESKIYDSNKYAANNQYEKNNNYDSKTYDTNKYDSNKNYDAKSYSANNCDSTKYDNKGYDSYDTNKYKTNTYTSDTYDTNNYATNNYNYPKINTEYNSGSSYVKPTECSEKTYEASNYKSEAQNSYPKEYSSSTYPKEYSSNTYPKEYSSNTYPKEYSTPNKYPNTYENTNYPKEYSSNTAYSTPNKYPNTYENTNYPKEYSSNTYSKDYSTTKYPTNYNSYAKEYSSNTYPTYAKECSCIKEYSSNSYPKDYSSITYPNEYSSITYPKDYSGSTYPKEYSSSTYPKEYSNPPCTTTFTSNNYPQPLTYTDTNYDSYKNDYAKPTCAYAEDKYPLSAITYSNNYAQLTPYSNNPSCKNNYLSQYQPNTDDKIFTKHYRIKIFNKDEKTNYEDNYYKDLDLSSIEYSRDFDKSSSEEDYTRNYKKYRQLLPLKEIKELLKKEPISMDASESVEEHVIQPCDVRRHHVGLYGDYGYTSNLYARNYPHTKHNYYPSSCRIKHGEHSCKKSCCSGEKRYRSHHNRSRCRSRCCGGCRKSGGRYKRQYPGAVNADRNLLAMRMRSDMYRNNLRINMQRSRMGLPMIPYVPPPFPQQGPAYRRAPIPPQRHPHYNIYAHPTAPAFPRMPIRYRRQSTVEDAEHEKSADVNKSDVDVIDKSSVNLSEDYRSESDKSVNNTSESDDKSVSGLDGVNENNTNKSKEKMD